MDTRNEFPAFKIKDASLADLGRKKIRMAEKEMPVLPLVASAIGAAAWITPVIQARSTMCSAIRSLMLPVKLYASCLA